MKKLFFGSISLFFVVGLVGAQSLGEIAKKERERREAQNREPVRVITDQDVRTGPEESDDALPGETLTPSVEDSSDASAEAPVMSSRERLAADPWNEVFVGFREAYNEARQRLEVARGFQRHCEDGTEPPPLPAVPGGYWMMNCEGLSADIEQIQAEMNAIQEDCFDRARRMGVPPGRARLN